MSFAFNILLVNFLGVCFLIFYFFAFIFATILGKICHKYSSLEENMFHLKEKKFLSLFSITMSILLLLYLFPMFFSYLGFFVPIFSDSTFGITKTSSEVIISLFHFLFFTTFYFLILKLFNKKMIGILQVFFRNSRNTKEHVEIDKKNKSYLYLYVSKAFYLLPIGIIFFEII